eukprot:m.571134 g.571134  ORF g.571134 m.571134 type:complete len:82 (+) comp22265_c1_seq37:391-636(+)
MHKTTNEVHSDMHGNVPQKNESTIRFENAVVIAGDLRLVSLVSANRHPREPLPRLPPTQNTHTSGAVHEIRDWSGERNFYN